MGNKDVLVTLFVVVVSYASLVSTGVVNFNPETASASMAQWGLRGETTLRYDPTVRANCGTSVSSPENFPQELMSLISSTAQKPMNASVLANSVSSFLENPAIQNLVNGSILRSYCFDPGMDITLISFYSGGNTPGNNTIGYFNNATGALMTTTARSGPSRHDYEPCVIVGRTVEKALFSCSFWDEEGEENQSLYSLDRLSGNATTLSE